MKCGLFHSLVFFLSLSRSLFLSVCIYLLFLLLLFRCFAARAVFIASTHVNILAYASIHNVQIIFIEYTVVAQLPVVLHRAADLWRTNRGNRCTLWKLMKIKIDKSLVALLQLVRYYQMGNE